jgi:general secretion pathway protein E
MPKRASKKRPPSIDRKAPAQAQAVAGPDVLNMDEAIASLKTTRPTFYRWLRDGRIKGFKLGRQWRFRKEDLSRYLSGEQPRVDSPVSAAPLVQQLRSLLQSVNASGPDVPAEPVAAAAYLMILAGFHLRASDMHLQPSDNGRSALLRHRVDGVMHTVATFDGRLLPALVARWKDLAGISASETSAIQDGRIMTEVGGMGVDLRVCIVHALHGSALTARLLRRQDIKFDIHDLGLSQQDEKRLVDAVNSPCGMVLINGPAGCGKTTVLYSCLKMLNDPQRKIMTIEDPVEYAFPGMVQMQVNDAAGMSFSKAIRAALRSDPDVVMVGEIRDSDTLHLCMHTSLTAHLVLSTLHADDSARALRRMCEMGLGHLLGDMTLLVLSQRLVRSLCPHCRQPAALDSAQEAMVAEICRRGGLNVAELGRNFCQPAGCVKCGQLGFAGRKIIAETLRMSPGIAKALRDNRPDDEVRRVAVSEGMTTMAADGIRLAAQGLTTLAEIQRVLNPNLM